MQATAEHEPMAKKKKSEVRRHTAMVRVDGHARDQAQLAAGMLRMSLADYASDVLLKAAQRDITRVARKLAGGEGSEA